MAESSALVLLIGLILASSIACIIVYAALLSSRATGSLSPSLESSLTRIVSETEARELLPFVPTSIVCNSGETFYWEQQALFLAVKPQRNRTRRSVLFPVANISDVRWPRRAGRVARAAIDIEDKGRLYLSDRRALFVGLRGAIEVPLDALVAIDRLPDGMKLVHRHGSTKLFVTGDPQAAIVLQRLINADTRAHLTPDAVIAAAEAHLRRPKTH
ncbi:MAG TPA: hypothetical protein VKG44_03015 [Candidatus Baltobacteraceae bacterium]|nr:hypothetical protein [Candidatus Baltobacteraceae bacterium]